MPRYGMVIDLDKCTACQACTVACAMENNIPYSNRDLCEHGRENVWIRVVMDVEGPPGVDGRSLPYTCMQCDNPPCIRVCPVFATHLSERGIVAQIYPRCIGCRYCTSACPYTVKTFNWYEPEWPGKMKKRANPDVSLRYKGVVEKCTFCHHRLHDLSDTAAIENRELADGEFQTACTDACPTNAIVVGDLDDPESQVSKLAESSRSLGLLESLGTKPKVRYLRSREKRIETE